MNAPLFAGLFAVVATTLPLHAHGGYYRGPGTPVVVPPGSPNSGPPTGGPAGPSTPGAGTPSTGAGPSVPEEVSWQVWWELNKDPFVQQRLASSGTTTGSDDFYLGQRRPEMKTDTLVPTDEDLTTRIVPALVALLERERNRDVQTACMMGLAKIGLDAPGVDLEQLLSARIARDDQEVRETAVLAIGIAGRPQALAMLSALLRDDAGGRKLCGREQVGDRTRAYAAYAIGLLAHRSNDAACKQQAHDVLWSVLNEKDLKNRDTRVAAVTGLGLLCHVDQPGHKRLAWLTAEELLEWYQRDEGRGTEAIQAHAPVAIGRLLGRGDSQIHQRCKDHFAATLNATNKRSNPILQSAALALGMLTRPAEVHAADAAASRALQIHWEKGHDRLARSFSVMALGRIGGAANRDWLLAAWPRGNKTMERPWLALALGLIAAQGAARGEIDTGIAERLAFELPNAKKPEAMGAIAVALGLTGHQPAVSTMVTMLRDNEHDETLGGYFCIGVALLGDPSTAPLLGSVLERSRRRPFLLLQAAVGLGRLGDREANDRLLAMLKQSESVAVLAALANAIGVIGDRRAIDPLVALTKDEELTKLARAFVAAALGGVGDRSPLPWNMPISRDSNYGAPVDTLSNGVTGVLDIL